MALPFFYKEDIDLTATEVVLDEATSKHIVQVLRMQNDEQLQLTDGKGNLFTCKIKDDNRKKCTVTINQITKCKPPITNITIAISLLNNTNRFEWFLEKATEIGVAEIIPLICDRTGKEKFREDRLKGILISALLQSQQTWLPKLHQPTAFAAAVKDSAALVKMLAHCEESEKQTIPEIISKSHSASYAIFIGPEGDFTSDEIKMAASMQCHYVSLGETRLRTETAGVVAAILLAQ